MTTTPVGAGRVSPAKAQAMWQKRKDTDPATLSDSAPSLENLSSVSSQENLGSLLSLLTVIYKLGFKINTSQGYPKNKVSCVRYLA